MARFQKLHSPETPGTPAIDEPQADESLDNDSELLNLSSQDLIKAVKARNTRALDELQKQMDGLRDDFVNQSVSIVEQGFKDCFFIASQRIRHLQLDWTTTDGNELGETIETIAILSATTEGEESKCVTH